jgi:hypothetical protein
MLLERSQLLPDALEGRGKGGRHLGAQGSALVHPGRLDGENGCRRAGTEFGKETQNAENIGLVEAELVFGRQTADLVRGEFLDHPGFAPHFGRVEDEDFVRFGNQVSQPEASGAAVNDGDTIRQGSFAQFADNRKPEGVIAHQRAPDPEDKEPHP